MKKNYLFLILLLFSFKSQCQIKYEKGYLINNQNQVENVLILNHYNIQNKGEIKYKYSEGGEIKIANSSEIKEFGIGKDIKYIGREVEVDVSKKSGEFYLTKKTNFKNKSVFLKVIVQGLASLYEYPVDGRNYYYYSNGKDGEIKPLVYRKVVDSNNKIEENNHFKKQLFDNFQCSKNSRQKIKNLKYSLNALINYFKDYNSCKNKKYSTYFVEDSKAGFHLNLKTGISLSTFQLIFGSPEGPSREFSKVTHVGFRPSIEGEFILPFYKNKFSIIGEMALQNFSYEENRYEQNVKVRLFSLEFPVGLRYHIYLKDPNLKLFLDAAYSPILNLNSEIYLEHSNDVKLSNKSFLQGGFGFKYKGKYLAECRIYQNRDIIDPEENRWYSKFGSVALILGYSLFN